MEHLELVSESNDLSDKKEKRIATRLELILTIITIIGIGLGAYVSLTNRVTALETNQETSKETDSRIERKIDYLIDIEIKKNNKSLKEAE